MFDSWLDKLADLDEDKPEDLQKCLKAVRDGLQHYQNYITRMLNITPHTDRPLFLAALKLTYETVMANDEELREVTEAVLSLPLGMAMTRRKGGADDGEV